MKKALNIIRATIIALAVMLIATPVSLYVVLSASWAQDRIRIVTVNELNALLGTEVSIGRIEIHPFNRISIHDIKALDDNRREALHIDEISAAFELFHLLRTGQLVIDFALVDRPELSLNKETPTSPLNIAGILSALKSDNQAKHQSRYDLKVNTVVIRNGKMRFDINDAPARDSVFDPSHIRVYDVFLNAYVPRISNNEYRLEIDRFSFKEKSGFELTNLTAAAAVKPDGSNLESLKIRLPHSTIDFAPATVDNKTIETLVSTFREDGISIEIMPGSSIYPPDFKSFAPVLADIDFAIGLSVKCKVSSHSADIERVNITTDDNRLQALAIASFDNIDSLDNTTVKIDRVQLSASSEAIKSILRHVKPTSTAARIIRQLSPADNLSLKLTADGRLDNLRVRTDAAFAGNAIRLAGNASIRDSLRVISYRMRGKLDCPDLSIVLPPQLPSAINAYFNSSGTIVKGHPAIELTIDSASTIYQGTVYDGISMAASYKKSEIDGRLSVNNRYLNLTAECNAMTEGKNKSVDAAVRIDHAEAGLFKIGGRHAGYSLSGMLDAQFEYSDIDDIDGTFSLSDICFCDTIPTTPDMKLSSLTLNCRPGGDSPGLEISSDFINGYINGPYRVSTLVPTLRRMVRTVFPSLESEISPDTDIEHVKGENNFTFSFQIGECEDACHFLHLPVSVIHTVGINGHVSDLFNTASINVDAPYLLQGDKIIESTRISSSVEAGNDYINLYATTKMPTKKGPMVAVADLSGASDRIDSRIKWTIERTIPINGSFDFSTALQRDQDNMLGAEINFNPGTITFGSDIWQIKPSTVFLASNHITVEDFALSTGDKSIDIDGIISADEEESVSVALEKIALLDIFETLEIDKALIGGTATGTFTGRRLLSSEPDISCQKLIVDSISYNRCVLGDADITAYWDNVKKSFNLDADILGQTGLHSHIFGDIFPATESLDITFDVNHAPVGFMKPFMSAFASDLSGYASGHARLFGTFKYIDMEGDIFADGLRIKIDFTNTWYSATDSIRLRPGVIDIRDITIRDINGHTAKLNGIVNHKYFKEPSFRFDVTDAREFLSYNVDSRKSPDWYGTIYGNGSAHISGEPGIVNIGVNMSTAPKSVFTFVLSDRLDADEYSFITFKDSRAEARRDSILAHDDIPEAVRNLRARLGNQSNDEPSAYNMDLQVDITPDARMSLIMDPVAGDEIKATGVGNLRLSYQSLNNDLKMYGTYTLDRGSYNFTLQDIIIKDFTIRQGSTIAFHGDPYSAQLDIKAIYSVNANLSDLDESFLLDKDLNRTNVPVHAMLLVKGDMRQPDIDFDLEFPTLTQDTYRKVRSIISTREMMNRQIIYLLALNRFYTPDYMASTTKGNELFSVASSTISSQLSSMLGKLSDEWSIAPNLRSDRGDFSDVEVDVALSSRLLNNRLLFNGNFGYRDKTLNTNQFIGDFDIEYLLNPKGTWRLKAYNRYNDQNYYVRTAQTTQGIGVVFKRDFDDFFKFLRRKKKSDATPSDSTQVDSTHTDLTPVDDKSKPDSEIIKTN